MVPRSPKTGNGAIVSRIAEHRDAMPVALSRIADHVISHPDTPVASTITELAEQAGSSPASVTRFCRWLGFAGYTQFRVAIATELGHLEADRAWRMDIGAEFEPSDTPEKVLRTLLNVHVRGLESTREGIDLDAVVEVAHAIATSHHVDIYGLGGSGGIAQELQRRLHRIGISAHAWSDVHDGLASAVLQDEHSVAIGVSSTGQTNETVQMLTQAAEVGAHTVAITHDDESWIATVADVSITTAAPIGYLRPDDMSVKHSQLLVVDLLYLLVAQQIFDSATKRLAATATAVSSHRRPRTPHARPQHTQEARR
ncbi:DNA-binding MurR/RpiR family transcriptional regulator [Microbacterium ginsengiterrae]|uniref:DNA-binding MurR/RpiR family transcriptional regulator n=1 Tax=Microbacterium ginsengiterrae TaxID=546115 RepID=A0A7W9CC09_9MICO|nr:MurR/RpiR family transcriptional regulator [Microbacterium ginsengiterrae]MBB5742816.1 DNA-binding MurR/RpiR family transcriptional regulator [Microbacterium ginsengiterrae]